MKNHNRPQNASPKSFRNNGKDNGKRHGGPQRGGGIRLPDGERLYGLHAVRAALANPCRKILALLVAGSIAENIDDELPSLPKGLQPQLVERGQLDHLLGGDSEAKSVHQGVLCVAEPLPEMDIEDVIRASKEKDLIVLLDQVTDPHNVGAILRSAAVFGVSAVVVTERNAPQAMGILAKSASGALERVSLVRVVNLARTIETLRENDYWCVGLAEGGTDMPKAPLPPKIALVMGAEGDGLRRLTKERCDALVALPGAGDFTTLNVSNAAAVALYHMFANR